MNKIHTYSDIFPFFLFIRRSIVLFDLNLSSRNPKTRSVIRSYSGWMEFCNNNVVKIMLVRFLFSCTNLINRRFMFSFACIMVLRAWFGLRSYSNLFCSRKE